MVWWWTEKKILPPPQEVKATSVDFDQLLEMVAVGFQRCEFAFRLNPQDMRECIACYYQNTIISVSIHLPVQSGSNRILKVNRLHTRGDYMTLIDKIELLFLIALSRKTVAGFPTETDQDHQDH
jgi:tRNA-2-methylthio-N6-dimethylallyladenosine synthase